MAVHFRYGGRTRPQRRLVEANDMMVVRTHRRGALEQTPLSRSARRVVAGFDSVTRFEEAGVEVLRATTGGRGRRDEARAVLKQEDEVQFAGRVLRPSRGRLPMVYTENLFVKFSDSLSERAARRLLRAQGFTIKRALGIAGNAFFAGAGNSDAAVGRSVFEVAQALLEQDAVELCHPELVTAVRDRQVRPEQWHLRATDFGGGRVDANVEAAWALTRGAGTVIAVIDDGFDTDHPDFRGAGKIVDPWDATRRRPGATPQFQSERHGTPCAGVACAGGHAGAFGVAPDARLMPIRLRSGVGAINEAEAIRWAVDHGADVISCSWGPPDGDWTDPADPDHDNVVMLPDHTRLALEHAVNMGRGGKGCVVVWAAGNGHEDVANDGYASSAAVMTVGACDDRGEAAPYSDFGAALWCMFPSDRKLPSFTPGIWTTDRGGGAGYNPGRSRLGDRDGNYTNGFGGTSAACPGAAGVAALVLARNPDLSWQRVRDVIAGSCDRIGPAADYDEQGRSPIYGFGRVNAHAAVSAAVASIPVASVTRRVRRDVPIRDFATAALDLDVPDTGAIEDLRVDVDIEHSRRGDLVVRLVPPAGAAAAVVLHDREGRWRDDLKRSYDIATTPALRALIGLDARGSWRLEVADRALRDGGRLRGFAIELDFAD